MAVASMFHRFCAPKVGFALLAAGGSDSLPAAFRDDSGHPLACCTCTSFSLIHGGSDDIRRRTLPFWNAEAATMVTLLWPHLGVFC